jgi:hypothetical protein
VKAQHCEWEEKGMGSGIERDDLMGLGDFCDYNDQERLYSVHVRETLLRLLRGERGRLSLLAKYHDDPTHLGVLPVPRGVDARAMRLPRVEEILTSAVRFLHDGTEGGPIAQSKDEARGVIVQRRDFPTRFPHIVIHRVDEFSASESLPIRTTWQILRLQNHRSNIQVNRFLDAANLGLSVLGFVK